jgi:hypothetical protein
MVPINRPSRRRRTIFAGLIVVALAGTGLGLLVKGSTRPPGELVASPVASLVVPSFPSVAPILPGSTPGVAATIPIVRPGFPFVGREAWQLAHTSSAARLIEGFASAPSYLPGQALRLAVSTSGASYRVSIFRVSGAAPAASPFVRMAELPSQAGQRQAAPVVDPVTKMVRAPWSYSVDFTIPIDWPSGVYLARLESDEDVQTFVPFVVRSARPTRFLVVSSALTWQAYNDWGGSDLYESAVGQPLPGVTRAFAVSFDRPYASDGGAGQLFMFELPMIAWLERQHLDLGFTTDYDLSVNPERQPLPRAVIFNGHSEYWGVPLRLWLEDHVLRRGDLSLGVFAADSGYWPVVLTGSGPDGPRSATCYKDGPPPESPGAGPPASAEPTGTSELLIGSGGDEEKTPSLVSAGPFPSTGPYLGPYVGSFDVQSLMGVVYQHITTAMANYTLSNPIAEPSLLDGTRIVPGAPLGFIAGGEVDAIDRIPGASAPAGSATGAVVAGAYAIPSRNGAISSAEAVYRSLANGAQVFASGTFYWGWALDPSFAAMHNVTRDFERLTLNLLTLLGR